VNRIFTKENQPIIAASACILVILAIGYTINRNFVSANYLLQQLEVASFLGIIAGGSMLVILLGHIDLSIPWTITMAAMTMRRCRSSASDRIRSAKYFQSGACSQISSAKTGMPRLL